MQTAAIGGFTAMKVRNTRRDIKLLATTFLIGCGLGSGTADAQQANTGPGAQSLPPVTIEQPRRAPTARQKQARPSNGNANRQARSRQPQAVPAAPAVTSAWAPANQAARSGTTGYVTTRTTTAMKTNTPLINTPQSVSVLTQEFLRDQNNLAFTENLRYVPGVIPHQGEMNRDDVVIRGQRSNADFYVNGVRDDVQYFRDVYNVQRVEVLKGPNAMIFGRGGGGGVINRVTKEADGSRVRDVTVGGGMFNDGRVAIDYGDAVNPNVAARINAVYEKSGSYRDFVNIERYGFNPTATFRPNDQTSIQLSYEYFHDRRNTDRGIPSQTRAGVVPSAANPNLPYQTAASTYFGNPDLSYALVDAHIGSAIIEHQFDNGLTVKNQTRVSSFDKFYANVYPGGAVNAAGTSVALTAYNNQIDRDSIFNQTDFTYKLDLGWSRHTFLAGAEIGRQSGISYRQSGFFNNAANPNGTPATFTVNPLNPTTSVPVTYRNVYNAAASDANSVYGLNLGAVYAQDQIEITRYLQIIGGVRFDHFDLTSTDRHIGQDFSRVDDLVSPRIGVVVKPVENVSVYGSYSISYLPSAGDQFSALNPAFGQQAGLVLAAPEKFENREIGVKWDINPRLQFAAAVYNLDRTNQRFADPAGTGLFFFGGATNTKGFETSVVGNVTDKWQVSGGYAYTDAKIVGATSATIVPGNRVGLVPYNTFTLWNKYEFIEALALGVGVIHQTDSFASSDDTVLLAGWTRVDAGIFGKFAYGGHRFRWQVNVENIFNQKYYATADGNNNITPGSPTAVRGAITASF